MDRREEISQLMKLTPEEVIAKSGDHLRVGEDVAFIDRCLVDEMVSLLEGNNRRQVPTVVIFPYGPVSQYPLFIEEVTSKNLTLANTTIFFMDEYADDCGDEVPKTHPLSFRGRAEKIIEQIPTHLRPKEDRIIFPNSSNIDKLQSMIENAGKIQLCIGGIGINGHIAFNEPEPGIRNTDSRLVTLQEHTVTMNTIREKTGGNILNFPRKAYTLGMNQIFGAKRIVLSCRNGLRDIQWSNVVLRLALLGKKGDDFPVTHLRDHENYCIVTDIDTLRTPEAVL